MKLTNIVQSLTNSVNCENASTENIMDYRKSSFESKEKGRM